MTAADPEAAMAARDAPVDHGRDAGADHVRGAHADDTRGARADDTRWAEAIERVAAVARIHAEEVDRLGRFPAETVAAMRAEGLLGALVPVALGGLGRSLGAVAAACYALGRACASSAMIYAMHQSQVACLVDHAAESPWLQRTLARIGTEGLLLGSVTSEVGTGGQMRASLCAVEPVAGDAGRFTLRKQGSSVSYGAYADALLVTARAHPAAEPADQVLVLVPVVEGVLTRTGEWNAMGMRGTCSDAFTVTAAGEREQIVPVPFAQVAAQSMVPVSHLLWSSVWCGIAADAVTRARLLLRGRFRAGGGALAEGTSRLVQAAERLQCLEARVRVALADYAAGSAECFAETASINMVKTAVSEGCLEVVETALLVCGFAGYSNGGPFSLSRHLRDVHSARLMIHNDRIRDNTARLLMLQAPRPGLSRPGIW
jgi:acyl-CoA dehydrogenase